VRLAAALRCDARLQLRNGFYAAAAFVVALWLAIAWMSRGHFTPALLPVVILNNLVIGTFYFLGAMVLLERGEGTLEALVVTPLRFGEYLGSKCATLMVVAVAENLVIGVAFLGSGLRPLPLVAGTLAGAAIFCLAGFVAVARHGSINDYILPSMAWLLVLFLPLFPYFGVGPWWTLAWHPVQPALTLLSGVARPLLAWEAIYGVGATLLWCLLLARLSARAYRRHVVGTLQGAG
jgi:fluoroquinolone transport system permease protein